MELTVEEKIAKLKKERMIELGFNSLIGLLIFLLVVEFGWIVHSKYKGRAAAATTPIVETKPPPEPVPKVEPEPKLSVPLGVPFSVESFSLLEKSDGTQYLLVNLEREDEEGISLFIPTDPEKTTNLEYYGDSYSEEWDGYYEWSYLQNSLNGRFVWFGEDSIGILLKSFFVPKHVIIENYEEWTTNIYGEKVLCVKTKPEDLNWVDVVSVIK